MQDNVSEKKFIANQWLQLFFALLMVGLPFFMKPAYPGEERVALGNWRIPPVCPHRIFFQQKCPGCGLIRSFTAFTHGQIQRSLTYHRLGIALYILVLFQIPIRIYLICKGSKGFSYKIHAMISWPIPIMILALIVNWLMNPV